MIVDRVHLKRVGYWQDPDDDKTDFNTVAILRAMMEWAKKFGDLKPLPKAQDCVDRGWDPVEKGIVISYVLFAGRHFAAEYGESSCRFCGIPNGNKELTDEVYVWPDGFAHYLVAHDVKPPQEFIDHVRSRT